MQAYPQSRFDNLDLLLQTLPGFWTDIYAGSAFVVDMLRAAAAQDRQLDVAADELYASISRQACPALHTDLWLPLELEEETGHAADLLHYGAGIIFGEGEGEHSFGGLENQSWAFPVDANLAACQLVADAVTNPTVLLGQGTEFSVRSGELVFARNPFIDARFRPEGDDAGTRRLRVYLANAQTDRRYLQTLYGSVLGLSGPSTANYHRLLNALLDGLTGATAASQIFQAVAAIADIPLAAGGETVEDVAEDADGRLVITDKSVYRLAAGATVAVAVGDALAAGQSLSDGLSLWRAGRGQIPAGIDSLTLSDGFLWAGIDGPLTFANDYLPLTVVGQISGYTKVTFPITGDASDVAAFFTEMHARGVAAHATLAQFLDVRESPSGQPTAANLPATLNPLRLVMENVLRSSLLVVTLKTEQFGPNNLGVGALDALRMLVPPHTGVLLRIDP